MKRSLIPSLKIENKIYDLECDSPDTFIVKECIAAYNDELAKDFLPVILDPKEHGSKPSPPDLIAYRLVIDQKKELLCIIYEVYWRRQDCSWMELNKDHDHDYEQIQIHFNTKSGKMDRLIVSSVGPKLYGGHGVEIFSYIDKAGVRDVRYDTSGRKQFPWGEDNGKQNITQVREIPIHNSLFDNSRPIVKIVNCYHAFAGLKINSERDGIQLEPKLVRLDKTLLNKWYYQHVKNRFGHDISKPMIEPHIMYYPPPEDFISRIFYGLLWTCFLIKMFFANIWNKFK